MKRMGYAVTALAVLVLLLASTAMAEKAPDAWVKGLWLKPVDLPAGVEPEDMSENGEEPYFLYCTDKGEDGPEMTMAVGRWPQNELAEKIFALDAKALATFVGSENFAATARNLKFTEAPRFSEKFTYPCQMAVYTNEEMGLAHAILFLQTDSYMFSAAVARDIKGKHYGEADMEKWLLSLELVEQ